MRKEKKEGREGEEGKKLGGVSERYEQIKGRKWGNYDLQWWGIYTPNKGIKILLKIKIILMM